MSVREEWMQEVWSRRRRAGRWVGGFIAMVVVAVAVSACGDGTATGEGSAGGVTTGVTDNTITIGSHQPLTGVAAPGFAEVAPASKAYFDYVNEHGGVYGRKIVYKVEDDAYDPSKAAVAVRKLVTQDGVFAIFNGLGTAAHSAVIGYLNAAKVPDLFVPACACFNQPQKYPYSFGWQPSYVTEGKVLGKYVAENFKGKKVGYLTQNDDLGGDGLSGLDDEIEGSQVVGRQTYSPTNPSLSSQVAALKASGAEVVVLFTVPTFTANFLLAAKQLGYHPQLVVDTIASDPETLRTLLGASGEGGDDNAMIEGMITDAALPSVSDESNSWTALFKKIAAESPETSKFPYDANVRFGMANAYTLVQALQAVGPDLTREALLETLQKGNFTADNPGLGELRYTPTDHGGLNGLRMGRIENGEIVQFGPVWTSDSGTGPVEEFKGKKNPAPADGIPAK